MLERPFVAVLGLALLAHVPPARAGGVGPDGLWRVADTAGRAVPTLSGAEAPPPNVTVFGATLSDQAAEPAEGLPGNVTILPPRHEAGAASDRPTALEAAGPPKPRHRPAPPPPLVRFRFAAHSAEIPWVAAERLAALARDPENGLRIVVPTAGRDARARHLARARRLILRRHLAAAGFPPDRIVLTRNADQPPAHVAIFADTRPA